jgi:hypothetical protein
MAGIVHISEEEAARDFGAVLKQARHSDSVVVAWRDGSETLILHKDVARIPERRTIAQAREILRLRRETQGLAVPDPDMASDMEEIHALYNQPMDMSRWD